MPRKKTPENEPLKEGKDKKIEAPVAGAADETGGGKTPAALEGMAGEGNPLDQYSAESLSAVLDAAGADIGPDALAEEVSPTPLEAVGASDDLAVSAEEDEPAPADDQVPAAFEFHLVSEPAPEEMSSDTVDTALMSLDEGSDPEGGAHPGQEEPAPDAEGAAGEDDGYEGAEPDGARLPDTTPHLEDGLQSQEGGPADDTDAAGTSGGDGHELETPGDGFEDDTADDGAVSDSKENTPTAPGEEAGEGAEAEASPAPKRTRAKKTNDDAAEKAPARRKAAALAAERTPKVAQPKVSLRSQNVRALDRDLTPEEKKEWDAIYASYTSKSILTGVVQGVDMNTFTIRNAEGLLETKKMASAVIISHRVKVLIPELEFSMPDKLLPESVVHHLDQCSIDYVIISVDRENNLAIASRRLAMSARRRYFRTAPRGHERGEELICRVLSVGPTRCTVECNGYDQEMRASDMGYNYIEDLREEFRPGDELRCRLVDYNAKDGLKVSVKEALHHPFDGAVERHPIGCTRHATITNKDSGAIFCLLSDNVSCVCRYAAQLNDSDFEIGDTVVIVVDSYYLEGKMIRGKILKKW